MQNKKVLIISMRAGFGHLRAGDALLEYSESLNGVKAEHVDVVNIYPPLIIFIKFYEFVAKKLPMLWGLTYRFSDNFFISRIAKFFTAHNVAFRLKIKKYVEEKNPDIILFTNMAPIAPLLSGCKKMLSNKKIGVVVTDFHGHYYYKFNGIDYYFVAHEQIKKDLERIGIASSKIIVTGIPINPRFYIKQDIKELKEKYGINNNLPVVLLIASFSASANSFVKAVKDILKLKPEKNVVFIANGKNDLFEKVNSIFSNEKRLVSVNWTNMMEEYMKIADIVVSKAGGLTVSECMSLDKKMIIVNPIPGQEEKNTEFLEKNGLAKEVENLDMVATQLDKFDFGKKQIESHQEPKINPSEKIFEILLK